MSAVVVVNCDRQYDHGTCGRFTYAGRLSDPAAVSAEIERFGWATLPDGTHRCPADARAVGR